MAGTCATGIVRTGIKGRMRAKRQHLYPQSGDAVNANFDRNGMWWLQTPNDVANVQRSTLCRWRLIL